MTIWWLINDYLMTVWWISKLLTANAAKMTSDSSASNLLEVTLQISLLRTIWWLSNYYHMTVCWLTVGNLMTIWSYVNYLLRMGPRWLHQTHQRAKHRRRHHRWAFWCIGQVQVGWWWQKRSQVQEIWVHRWRPSFSCQPRGAKDQDRYLID